MSVVKNDRLLKALRREPVDRPPIWLMRQAGRYLPEYRATRKQAGDFLTLCKTPELACEVTLQPLRRFGLDAAIIFSDILTIPDAMGLGLHFVEGEGPKFERPIRDSAAIQRLSIPERGKFNYLAEAIKLVVQELKQQLPLIGFSGSPWTLATYMVEGGGSKDFRCIRRWRYADPESLRILLQLLADAVVDYLLLQVEAGVHALMLFDTWGGILTTDDYALFSLYYMQQVINKIKKIHNNQIPIILFTKQGGQWLEMMASTGVSAVGIDWTTDLRQANMRVGKQVALQGNLDPALLYASPSIIRQKVAELLRVFAGDSGLIINLGHGVPLDVDPLNVAVLVDSVQQLSQQGYDQTQ